MCVCVCVYIYIYIYIYMHVWYAVEQGLAKRLERKSALRLCVDEGQVSNALYTTTDLPLYMYACMTHVCA
jgi:hypothetical protein